MIDIVIIGGIINKALIIPERKGAGHQIMHPEHHHILVPQRLPKLSEIQVQAVSKAHPRLVLVIPPGGGVQNHLFPLRNAQMTADLPHILFGVIHQKIISGIADLQQLVLHPAGLQIPGRRKLLAGKPGRRENPGEFFRVHIVFPANLTDGVHRVFRSLQIISQTFQGRSVPALDIHLILPRPYMVRHPVIGNPVAGAGQIPFVNLCLLADHRGVGILLQKPVLFGVLEGPYKLPAVKFAVGNHIFVNRPRAASVGLSIEGVEHHRLLIRPHPGAPIPVIQSPLPVKQTLPQLPEAGMLHAKKKNRPLYGPFQTARKRSAFSHFSFLQDPS